MIEIKDDSRCSGCGSCYNICPERCISMVKRADGFSYPVVDKGKCINCRACEKVCPYLNYCGKGDVLKRPTIIVARTKDDCLLSRSSSGGVFAEAARCVLDNNGIVFGCVWGDCYDEAHHDFITSKDDLWKMQGSKYVQSDIRDNYAKARDFLKAGKKVLFSGTPCQIAGLLTYLEKDYENLITMDLVCHGVPSSLATKRFVEEREKKTGKRVAKYYRDKTLGWKPGSFRLEYKDGTSEVYRGSENKLTQLFSYHLANLRNSCYGCRFSRSPRVADISMGDYFVETPALDSEGKEVHSPDNLGYSLITINTAAGKSFFEIIKEKFDIKQLQSHTVKSWTLFQGPGSAANPESRQMFFYLYDKGMSIDGIYSVLYGKNRFKRLYYRILKKMQHK